jgi:hypothetical protein
VNNDDVDSGHVNEGRGITAMCDDGEGLSDRHQLYTSSLEQLKISDVIDDR